jgi:hypothetical protein
LILAAQVVENKVSNFGAEVAFKRIDAPVEKRAQVSRFVRRFYDEPVTFGL